MVTSSASIPAQPARQEGLSTRTNPGTTLIAAGVLALCVLFTRAAWFGDPAAGFDEQLYSLIGQRWLEGALPYADLWDRKPAGLFALYALAHGIGGSDPLAYQLLAALFVFAGSWLTFLLARPFCDRLGAVLAGSGYAVLLPLYGSHSGQSELFFLPLLLLALKLIVDRSGRDDLRLYLIAMFVCGLALQVKYSVFPGCLALGLIALWQSSRKDPQALAIVRRAVIFVALGIAPTAVAAGYFAMQGEFAAFWNANFQSFFAREGLGRLHPRVLNGLLPLALPALAGLWLAQRKITSDNRSAYGIYAIFAAGLVASVFFAGTVYFYYLAALVPAALLLALPLFGLRSPWGRMAVLVLLGFWATLYTALDPIDRSRGHREGMAMLTQAIAPLVDRDENCLYIYDGPSALYTTTQSCIPTRFVYPDHLNNALERDALGVSQIGELRRVLASRPPVIVTADEPVAPRRKDTDRLIAETLARYYEPITNVRMDDRVVSAWRRRDN